MQNKLFIASRFLFTRDKGKFISIVSLVSSIAITIGIASILIVLSIMNGFESEIHKRILNVEPHITIKSTQAISSNPLNRIDLTFIEGIESISSSIDSKGVIQFNNLTAGVQIKGLDILDNNSTGKGFFGQFKLSNLGSSEIIIGKSLAYRMGIRIGDQLIIRIPSLENKLSFSLGKSRSYIVSEIIEFGLAKFDNSLVIVASNQLLGSGMDQNLFNHWSIMVKDPYQTSKYIIQLERLLNNTGLTVSDWSMNNSALFKAIVIEKTIMSTLLFLVVLVAMFNIMVMISMTINEKSKDIAILRTLGFREKDITQIFFLQGMINALMGIFFGLLLGVIALKNLSKIEKFIDLIFGFDFFPSGLYYISNMPYLLRLQDIIIISVVAFLVSFLAAYLPSMKASKKDPALITRFYRN